ncbi:MAG: methyltransferase regulatory domain-containing protein [Burkholderiales bacterium]|nr:methyltransferase regulatory domain-containing protein [Burkholderiales bacterium]
MSSWTDGYVTEVDYTYGYYREMAPVAMRYALLASGHEAPPLHKFNYCELGYGQGAGLSLLAAVNPQGQFWGTDFNPAHAAGAAQMAKTVGLDNLHVSDDSFEEFCARDDLPKFDYITLHGVYSWVGTENCSHIVNFLHKHLNVGGAVYISYNTLPGWTHALPMRGLLSQFVDLQTAPTAPLAQRIEGAVKLLNELNEVPGGYFKMTPQLSERIKGLQRQNANYLAHEYLNRHWTPFFFSQIVDDLAEAKLSFAAHAIPLNCIDAINHTPELQAILDKITNPIFREVVRDLGINQTFRRDIFVRGPRRLQRHDHAAGLLDTTYVLATPRALCNLKIRTTIGEAQLQESIYAPVLDKLAQGPQTGHQLAALPAVQEAGGQQRLLQVLVVLVGTAYIQPCVPEPLQKPARAGAGRFNQMIMARAARGGDVEMPFMASALIGSGVQASRLQQLFQGAMMAMPKAEMKQHAEAVWATMKATGQVLIHDGKRIEGDDACVLEISTRMAEWRDNQMPIARGMGLFG